MFSTESLFYKATVQPKLAGKVALFINIIDFKGIDTE